MLARSMHSRQWRSLGCTASSLQHVTVHVLPDAHVVAPVLKTYYQRGCCSHHGRVAHHPVPPHWPQTGDCARAPAVKAARAANATSFMFWWVRAYESRGKRGLRCLYAP